MAPADTLWQSTATIPTDFSAGTSPRAPTELEKLLTRSPKEPWRNGTEIVGLGSADRGGGVDFRFQDAAELVHAIRAYLPLAEPRQRDGGGR